MKNAEKEQKKFFSFLQDQIERERFERKWFLILEVEKKEKNKDTEEQTGIQKKQVFQWPGSMPSNKGLTSLSRNDKVSKEKEKKDDNFTVR